jgi:hypothetical protein
MRGMNEAASGRLLPALFDPAQGWPFSENEVPLARGKAEDGNPFVVVTVDGREVVVAEKTAWAGDEDEGPSPHRIVAFLAFTGIAVDDTNILLQENLGTHGLPAWGVDDDGDLTLSVSVLVGPSVPLDVVRRQLLVGIGLIAETVDKVVDAVSDDTNGQAAERSGEITRRFLSALSG